MSTQILKHYSHDVNLKENVMRTNASFTPPPIKEAPEEISDT